MSCIVILTSFQTIYSINYGKMQLQVNYVKHSTFEFLTLLQFSSLPLHPCKSLEGICNVPIEEISNGPNFTQFLLEVPNFLFCHVRCYWLTKNPPTVTLRTEQNRTEQNRTEQNRTEQNRTEQNRTGSREFKTGS
jgi:hypothetical protein